MDGTSVSPNQAAPIDRTLVFLWVAGVVLMLLFGWLNYSVNSWLNPEPNLAELYPMTTTACLLPEIE
ncbi:MAG: hypothetical protein AAF633_18055 [Chloroflexota bacterium]